MSATPSAIGLSADIDTDVAAAETALRQVISCAERPVPDTDRFALPEVELADRALSSDLLPEAWDEWVVVERERLRRLRLHALESLSSAHRAAGHYGQALDAALLAVAAEPLRGSARRHVIETHLAEGNTGEAIRHFTQLQRLFETELGLSPTLMLHRTMDAVRATQCLGRDAWAAANGHAHPMTGHENRTGVLIVRTWYEERSTPAVWARLLVANGPHDAPSVYATAAGLDDICECGRRWLRDWSKDTSELEGGHEC